MEADSLFSYLSGMRQLTILLILFLLSCSGSENTSSEEVTYTDSQISTSDYGAVSTAHPEATRAGVKILEKGGNAIDAAVASAFALSVVEPSMSGIGGRLQAIVIRSDGAVSGVDATTQAGLDYDPETAPEGRYGYPVIGIPGVVKGLTKLQEQHGNLSLMEVMEPAIELASGGFQILEMEARRHAMMIGQVKEFPGSSKYFLDGDTTYIAGKIVVQPDLASTLKTISEQGENAFYGGSIAEKIVADVSGNGGTLSLEAMAAYEARDAEIVTGSYRGYDIHALWMPSFGAITIEMLHILENFDFTEVSEEEWGRLVFEANKAAYNDRDKQTDADAASLLTSKEYAREISQTLNKDLMVSYNSIGPDSWSLNGHTTHLSVADMEGNMIALTQSLGPNMGSRVATDGLGFLYATTLGGYLGDFQPGQRAASHISPVIISKDGKPVMALGAAGGSRIITAIVQTISRLIDFDMPLDKALAAGRVHSGDTVMLVETHEGTWNADQVANFREMGYKIIEVPDRARFGRVHAVMFDDVSGKWVGAADPDWEGTSAAPSGSDEK